jgi:hypothetical protein
MLSNSTELPIQNSSLCFLLRRRGGCVCKYVRCDLDAEHSKDAEVSGMLRRSPPYDNPSMQFFSSLRRHGVRVAARLNKFHTPLSVIPISSPPPLPESLKDFRSNLSVGTLSCVQNFLATTFLRCAPHHTFWTKRRNYFLPSISRPHGRVLYDRRGSRRHDRRHGRDEREEVEV